MEINYIYHSGFAIETENYKLIFDYYKTPKKNNKGFEINKFLQGDKKILIFSSHSHHDHFNSEILSWQNRGNIEYILSSDIDISKFKIDKYRVVKAGDTLKIDNVEIRVFGSSDEGVSFYVDCDNKKFFHCGDLNWWYWSDDSPQEEKYMKELYCGIVENIKQSLRDIEVDYCFYPIDFRLEEFSFLGIEYFINKIKVKNIIPMHMWDRYEIIETLKNKLPNFNIVDIHGNCEKIV